MPTMRRYKVALAGCGPRGDIHAHGFRSNPDRFELAAACDIRPERLQAFTRKHPVERIYTDAGEMLAAEKPDVFCFCTQPNVRLPLIELGVQHGVKAIAYEKPMATSLAEAKRINDLCDKAGIKTVVSHQQKYGPHWQKVKQIVDAGEIGAVERIHASSKAWLSQLGTHLIDYLLWYNGQRRIKWVVGHVHGRGKLSDSHPSPDYLIGQLGFENGVRAFLECGYLAPDQPGPTPRRFWWDNGITIYGSHGYARVSTGGGWQALTKSSRGEILSGPGEFNPAHEQPLYLRDLADWLDDPDKTHPCNGAISYHGFEATMALCLGALDARRIDLPLNEAPAESVFDRMQRDLPDVPGSGDYGPQHPIKTW